MNQSIMKMILDPIMITMIIDRLIRLPDLETRVQYTAKQEIRGQISEYLLPINFDCIVLYCIRR